MNNLPRGLLILIAIVLLAGYPLCRSVMYTVNERELAVILQFGEPVEERTEPDLYFKTPLVQDVLRLPKTLQFWSAGEHEILRDLPTADGKKIEVTPWAVWRITEPKQFVRVLRTMENAESRVRTIVRSTMRDVITSHKRAEVVRSTPRTLKYPLQRIVLSEMGAGAAAPPEGEAVPPSLDLQLPGKAEPIGIGREDIVAKIKAMVKHRLEQTYDEGADEPGTTAEGTGEGKKAEQAKTSRGIVLVDVGISRIDFVPQVREAANDNLIKFWDSIAAKFLNEGELRKQEILNETNAEVEKIEGEGEQESKTRRGTVDAQIIDMYAEAINETGEFYNFIRTLEAYKMALKGNTSLILTTNSEFFRLLKEVGEVAAPSESEAAEQR